MPSVFIDGVAVWTPRWPSWELAQRAFCGEAVAVEPPAKRPAPTLLPATERRRAPDTVALALEVASQAVQASGHAATDLPSVFTSAHGDLAINDTMCATLASTPTLLSPTKFHNSVHNAAAGYWTMGTGCMQTSTAVTAFDCSWAAGLLEALSYCTAEQRPVLLVGYDTEACGPLASVTQSKGLLALAVVLSPRRGEHSQIELKWDLEEGDMAPAALRSEAARSLSGNAMADGLPMLEALAQAIQPSISTGSVEQVDLPLSSRTGLRLALSRVSG